MIRITDILDRVTETQPDADVDIIDRAYIFSARVMTGRCAYQASPTSRTLWKWPVFWLI